MSTARPVIQRSSAVRQRAHAVLPGGVSSPVRAFRAVSGEALIIERGEGARVIDSDDRTYIDCVLAYGPHILGHCPPTVIAAIARELERGTAFGATTELEVELAERICRAMPSMEMLRFVNSGTEATMSAVRLARAATGRDIVVVFSGGYHGHSDALLAAAGSGVATLSIAGSPGVPKGAIADTLVLEYNDIAAVEELFGHQPERIAAVLVEPVAGNMGCVLPAPGFLETVRRLTTATGSLLILDEVMTGFRVGPGGAQALYGVTPDLTCLGKVIGGGLPVAAYGGRRDLMCQVAPEGPVYQAGTLSGNPLAMSAGIAVLDILLADDTAYRTLEARGARLEAGLREALSSRGAVTVNRVGSMLTAFLGVEQVTNYTEARRADRDAFSELHGRWLEGGVFWPPSQFECGFLSTAHSEADIDRIVELAAP